MPVLLISEQLYYHCKTIETVNRAKIARFPYFVNSSTPHKGWPKCHNGELLSLITMRLANEITKNRTNCDRIYKNSYPKLRKEVKMLEKLPAALLTGLSSETFNEYMNGPRSHRYLLRCRYRESRIDPTVQGYLVSYPDFMQWVVVVDEESPDTIAILPILQRLADCSMRINLQIISADHDLSFFEQVLDDNDVPDDLSESEYPLLFIFDEEWAFLAQWGPRPEAADPYLESWLESHPEYEQLAGDSTVSGYLAYSAQLNILIEEMRVWYNSELEQKCIDEIHTLLQSIQEQSSSDEAEDFEGDSEAAD